MPKAGLCADHCRGEVTDIRLWGDVSTALEKPAFTAGTDTNSAILTEMPVAAAKAFDPVLYEGIAYKNTYAYSATVRVTAAESGKEDYGIGMLLGTAELRGKTAYIEVRFQPGTRARAAAAAYSGSGNGAAGCGAGGGRGTRRCFVYLYRPVAR